MTTVSRLQGPRQEVPTGADTQQYLTFMVAGETFAFGIRNIKEIIEYGHVTQVPMMPRFVRGVINLRGRVVPVIDLAMRFKREASVINKRSCIVIMEIRSEESAQDVGVVVDSICEVLEIPGAEIEPPPSFGVKIRTEFIGGMGKVNGHFVILLDMNNVLELEEITQLEALSHETGEPAAG